MSILYVRLSAAAITTLLISLSGCSGGGGDSADTSVRVPDSVAAETVSSDTDSTVFSARFCHTNDPDQKTFNDISAMFRNFTARARVGDYSRNASFLDDILNSLPNSDTDSLDGLGGEGLFGQEVVNIPVYFTIISKGGTAEEGFVTDAQLTEQINVMNQAYSGATGGAATPFQFYIADTTRVTNPDLHVLFPASPQELEVKQTFQRGDAGSLNVYIVDIQDPQIPEGEGTMLGYSSMPFYYKIAPFFDGIVLNYKSLPAGPADRYNLGHVLVHESGHWLGLFHTFLGECDEFYNDLVADTPREMIPQRGNYCPLEQDSCPHLEGADPIHNHMTYTEDGCRFEFTAGQVFFMKFNALFFRQMPVIIDFDEIPQIPTDF